MSSDVQALILEVGRETGLLPPDVVQAYKRSARTSSSPILKELLKRDGFSPQDLDRILERFWAQNGNRRGLLHRAVEDRILGRLLVTKGVAGDAQVEQALAECRERQESGQSVRVLSVLVDAGVITGDTANEILVEVQKEWAYCRYCLSGFPDGAKRGCEVCGRPLTAAARTYEIVELSTLSTDTAPEGGGKPGVAPASAEGPSVGMRLAGIKLLERVDDLGRGRVYRGERLGDSAARAIKIWQVSRDLSYDDIIRFGSAALSAAKFDHEALIKVHEVGEEQGFHFVVMDWVGGRALDTYIEKNGKLRPKLLVEVALKVLSLLELTHADKILHKNLTPGNVLLTEAGGVKVGDFGVAKDYGVSLESVTGNVIGRPDFLAPEQCKGHKADDRTDIFSLGAVLYFAMSGKNPYEGDSAVSIAVKRLTEDPKPLRQVAPGAPMELVRIIEKMMEREPDKRFQSARDVTEALEAFKNPPPSFLAKHGTLVGVIAAAVLVLAGGAFGAWWLATHRPLPEDLVSGLDEARQCIAGKQFASAEKLLVELDGRFEPTQEIEDAKNLLVDAGHEHAGSFARKHNYEEALEILRAVTAAARGVGRAGEHGARIDEVESQKTAFSTRAREVYGDLIDELPGLPEGEQVTKLEAFMEAFPWTAPAKQARLQLQKVSVHWRQGLVLDEVEETLSGLTLRDAEIDQTLAEARRELTDVKLFGALESERKKRYEALKKDLEFLESVHKGIEACEAGDFDEGLPMLRVKAAAFPDDPRARQGLAWGRSLREEDLGRVEEEAGNPEGALKHYRKARTLREEAGFDVEAISQKIDEFDQEADRFKEVTRKVRVVEKRAERAEAENRWSQAFKLREEAFGLRSTQERKALLERARKKARVDEEEKAYGTLLRKLKATRLSEGKQALCRAFLDEFPDGAHRERVRDLLELEAERVFQKPEAQPIQPGRRPGEFRNPRDGATMVKVEAGRFFRGTSKEEAALTAALWGAKASFFKPEQPMAEVELSAFYVDVFEVTNEQYGAFLEAIASIPEAQRHHFCHEDEERGKDHTPEFWRDSRWNRKDLPVVGVDWFDAFAYARWTGKRLPTEAQWERAARGTQRLRYPWGQDGGLFLSNGAEVWAGHKFKGNSDIRAWQVSKLWEQHGLTVNGRGFGRDRSVEGCRHMAGNVREWCVDWYLADAYEKPTGKDPVATEPGPNQQKATRGGSWFDTGMYHRVTLRRKLKPLSRRFDVGFRCVRDVE